MSITTERIPKSAARVLDAARIRAEYKQKKRARMQMEGLAADTNDDHVHTGGAPKPPPHKKRRTEAGAGAGAEKCRVLSTTKGKEHHHLVDTQAQAIEIQPGESLKHFNRRVEDHMRPLVQSAMLASATTERKERKRKAAAASSSSASHTSTATTTTIKKASVKDTPSTTARRDNDDDNDDDDDDDHRPKEFAVMSSAAPRRLNDIAMAPPELNKFPRGVKTTKYNSPAAGAGAGAGAGVLSMAQRVMMEAERESAIKRYREMKERKTKEVDRTLLTV